ncbi:MAG TPA: response regulator transcription factor [Coleofasciculaceae cyanobacterium]|jgi:two-component system NarL family response regulator
MIRVLLVEDDEIFRIGLTTSLKKSGTVDLVGTCEDGATALVQAEVLKPDLILMDVGLPVMTGIEATQEIKKRLPGIKVLALTSHTESKTVNQIMDAGADGFCLKGVSTERLIVSIEEVYRGTFWVDAAVAELFRSRYVKSEPLAGETLNIPTETLKTLTEREQEVLGLIAQGKKNSEIADMLCISPGTVRVHVHSILHKLDVRDRTQAALMAKQFYSN